jgi:hypothetical protein
MKRAFIHPGNVVIRGSSNDLQKAFLIAFRRTLRIPVDETDVEINLMVLGDDTPEKLAVMVEEEPVGKPDFNEDDEVLEDRKQDDPMERPCPSFDIEFEEEHVVVDEKNVIDLTKDE